MTLDSSLAASFFSATFSTFHCRPAMMARLSSELSSVSLARTPRQFPAKISFEKYFMRMLTNFFPSHSTHFLAVLWAWRLFFIVLWLLAAFASLENANKGIPEWERSKYLHHYWAGWLQYTQKYYMQHSCHITPHILAISAKRSSGYTCSRLMYQWLISRDCSGLVCNESARRELLSLTL